MKQLTILEKWKNKITKEMEKKNKQVLADQKRRILNNVIRLISEADLKEFDKV